jgi:hypothetical protein
MSKHTVTKSKPDLHRSDKPQKKFKLAIKGVSSPQRLKTANTSVEKDTARKNSPKKVIKTSDLMRDRIITELENFKLDNVKVKLENNFNMKNVDLSPEEKVRHFNLDI